MSKTGELEQVQPTDPLKDATSSEYRDLQEMKRRDQEVRQHERAHVAAGGQYVRGGASFSYQRGPDGKQYAVGGEVQIDTSPIANDPEATIRKMQAVRRAALAPAEPSPQDRAVAASATSAEMAAHAEVRTQEQESDRHVSTADDDSLDLTPAIEGSGDAGVQSSADDESPPTTQQRGQRAVQVYGGVQAGSPDLVLDLIA